MTAERECRRCGSIKPADAFPPSGGGTCKRCKADITKEWRQANGNRARVAVRAWHEANPERVKEYRRMRYRDNAEVVKAAVRARYVENPSRVKKTAREWAKANPDRVRNNQRAWAAANREATNARALRWARANPDKRAAVLRAWQEQNPERLRFYARNRRAKERGATGIATEAQVEARIKFYGGRCYICTQPAVEMDHVKPLVHGGSQWPANLRPICGSCNSRKGGKWPYAPALKRRGAA